MNIGPGDKGIEELEAELLEAIKTGRKIDWGIPKDLYESMGIEIVDIGEIQPLQT